MNKHQLTLYSRAWLCLLLWALPANARPPGPVLDLLASEQQAPVQAFPGALDKSFSGDGKLTSNFEGSEEATGVVLQKDGKIVVVGTAAEAGIVIARYLGGGGLDSAFGTGGKVTVPCGLYLGGSKVMLQPDGRIVVTASCSDQFLVARLLPGGALDCTFGDQGTVSTAVAEGFSVGVSSLALQADGKIVVLGSVFQDYSMALARFQPNGALDETFGVGGKLRYGEGAFQWLAVSDMAVQTDGKIVVAGGGYFGGISADSGLLRFLPNGTLDASFGNGGQVITDYTGFDYTDEGFQTVAFQPDGKIVAAGGSAHLDCADVDDCREVLNPAVVRYLPNGTLDQTFDGGDGIAIDPGFWGGVNDIAIQVNGSIVAALDDYWDFKLERFTANGRLDTSFGTWDSTLGTRTGRIAISFGTVGGHITAVAIEKTAGKVVLVGSINVTGYDADFALARVHAFTCRGYAATLIGTPQADLLKGTAGADVILGLGGDDRIFGLNGDDALCGGSGSDTLLAAADSISVTADRTPARARTRCMGARSSIMFRKAF